MALCYTLDQTRFFDHLFEKAFEGPVSRAIEKVDEAARHVQEQAFLRYSEQVESLDQKVDKTVNEAMERINRAVERTHQQALRKFLGHIKEQQAAILEVNEIVKKATEQMIEAAEKAQDQAFIGFSEQIRENESPTRIVKGGLDKALDEAFTRISQQFSELRLSNSAQQGAENAKTTQTLQHRLGSKAPKNRSTVRGQVKR